MHDGLIIPLVGIMHAAGPGADHHHPEHRQKKREWQHQERLRALELGLPAPERTAAWAAGPWSPSARGSPWPR